MALLVHAYQLEGSDVHSLMVALRQLNTVEEAEEDMHEVFNPVPTSQSLYSTDCTNFVFNIAGGGICYSH